MKKILALVVILGLFVFPLTAYACDGSIVGNSTINEVTTRYIPCPVYSEGHKVILQSYCKVVTATGSHVLHGLTCYWTEYKVIKIYSCDCGYGYQKIESTYRDEDCNYWV